jgi:DNA-binding NtrC family response regulator
MEFLAMVIEPDDDLRRLVREGLREDGWRVVEACSADEAFEIARRCQRCPLIYCNDTLRTTSSAGSHFLNALRMSLAADTYIVSVGSGVGSNEALDAIMSGASDYIPRPHTVDDVYRPAGVVKQRLLAALSEATQPALSVVPTTAGTDLQELGLVGASEAIISVFRKIAQSLTRHSSSGSKSEAEKHGGKRPPSYFITGETGTGKELVAHLIHSRSSYADGQFVPINCSALPEELAESELFGHEPGAFTGAVREKKGLWELADGGTLFLDEITEAPRAILPKLLRVLQDRTIKRLGSNRWIPVEAQVIAASNRDLKSEIKAGRFREDLYHRLSLFEFHLPPLRERRKDIPLLVAHFAGRYAAEPVKFSQDALDLLMQYQWPGNVRELENLVRAAVTHAADGMIYAVDMLPRLQAGWEVDSTCRQCRDKGVEVITPSSASLDAQVKLFKLKTVREALRQHRGNITHTAAALGMTRPTLYKLLRELNNDK